MNIIALRCAQPKSSFGVRMMATRKQVVACEKLRGELKKMGVFEERHNFLQYLSLQAEINAAKVHFGGLKTQKRHLLRQIIQLNPDRHPTYKGLSVAELKEELKQLQSQNAEISS